MALVRWGYQIDAGKNRAAIGNRCAFMQTAWYRNLGATGNMHMYGTEYPGVGGMSEVWLRASRTPRGDVSRVRAGVRSDGCEHISAGTDGD